MAYVKIVDGAVSVYPYSFAALRADNPQVSFPGVEGSWLNEWGVYAVAPTAQPAPDVNFDVVEGTPVLVGDTWTQVWTQVAASPEDVAFRNKQITDASHRDAVKADTFVQNFIAMTPAQVETYVNNNTANLAEVRSLLTKMGIMLLILARKQFS